MKGEFLEELIKEIAPLNNRYRMAVRNREPAHVVLGYLWDIGDVLLGYGVERLHPLAREIQEQSYITASLLSYAYRIRRYFKDRRTIKRNFGKVSNFSLFREAFPLLENPRYNLSRREKSELVRLLNSGADTGEISVRLAALKQRKRPRKNARSRHPEELGPFVPMFLERMRDLEEQMEKIPRKQLHAFRDSFPPDFLLYWNRLVMSLADENLTPPKEPPPLANVEESWASLVEAMYQIASGGKSARNRACRLLSPMEFLRMADYVDILRDEGKLERHIKRRASGKREMIT